MSSSMSAQDVVERALAAQSGDGLLVIVKETSTANLRWAANALTTNGHTRSRSLTVVATVDGKEGTSSGVFSTSHESLAAIPDFVGYAEAAARAAQPAEDAQPLVPSTGTDPAWSNPSAETTPSVFTTFAPELGQVLAGARAADRELFGFAEHSTETTYLGTSTGVRLRHEQPTGKIEVTGKSHQRSRSAWVGEAVPDFSSVDIAAMDAEISRRLQWSARTIDLPAGRYETILPPGAVSDLLVYAYWSMAARDAHEGRSVFSRPGGGTRVGERLTDRGLTLRSDPHYRGLECSDFVADRASSATSSVFDSGLPLSSTEWIREGELAALLQTRHTAELTGLPLTPGIDNLILEDSAGAGTEDDLIAATDYGLLLTCLWYIREVDPQTLLLTGLTRDGVHLVEGGEVVGTVNNFRFNESPIDLLGRVSASSTSQACLPREWGDYFTRAAMPAVRVDGFNMSSVSQAS